MKLHLKLFLILLLCIVLFVSTTCWITLHLLQDQTEKEKLNMTYGTLKQTLLSYEYVTDNIERYLYNQCRAQEITSCLCNDRSLTALSLQLQSKIRSIATDPMLMEGFIADTQDRFFPQNDGEAAARFRRLFDEGFFGTDRDVYWKRDGENHLYLRRNIYQIYPYKLIAYAVFEINQSQLCNAVGMDWFVEGNVCILDGHGNIALLLKEDEEDRKMFEDFIRRIRQGEVLPRSEVNNGTDYRIIAVNGISGNWNAIYLVRADEMLGSFYHLRDLILWMGAGLILGAAVVSYLVSLHFTANVRKLKSYIGNVRYGDTISQIPDMGQDEIGDLAEHFNGLLKRLDQTYTVMLQESQEKQRTRYELLMLRYRSLQSQISPHFLCNILGSISTLSMASKTNQVEQLAIDASRYLRNNLNQNDKRYNTIQGEVRLMRDYLQLVNQISAVPIVFQAHYPKELRTVIVPNLILQPLAENAIKHGIPPQLRTGFKITFRAHQPQNDVVELELTDNGVGVPEAVIRDVERLTQDRDFKSDQIGFGLAGIILRLTLQYGDDFQFQMSNLNESGTLIRMRLPIHDNAGIQ